MLYIVYREVMALHSKLQNVLKIIHKLLEVRIGELESQVPASPLNKVLKPNECKKVMTLDPEATLSLEESVILALALLPQVAPHFLDSAISSSLTTAANYSQIGGVRGKESRIFLPTGETAFFLIGESSITSRIEFYTFFATEAALVKRRLVELKRADYGEPFSCGILALEQGVLEYLLGLPKRKPKLGAGFPAELIETALEWEDLVLETQTRRDLAEIETWIQHGDTLLSEWGMGKYLKPGYRVLFHGVSGTGKTLAASLLGKYTGRDVYRIDLSMVVSKFIGETEKNLAKVFDQAEHSDWILFFDEADALFGKRTGVKDSHDRYANQEVSYLLQRVEGFNGLVILATNFLNNIDDAFLRRFPSVIHFPKPSMAQRVKLWNAMMPHEVSLHHEVDIEQICRKNEFTGANIANILQYASLQALKRGEKILIGVDIDRGIAKEYQKEGKLV